MLPLYPLNNVTQFHEWRGRILALTDGVLAAIFRITSTINSPKTKRPAADVWFRRASTPAQVRKKARVSESYGLFS